jgi:hypothetical protein
MTRQIFVCEWIFCYFNLWFPARTRLSRWWRWLSGDFFNYDGLQHNLNGRLHVLLLDGR